MTTLVAAMLLATSGPLDRAITRLAMSEAHKTVLSALEARLHDRVVGRPVDGRPRLKPSEVEARLKAWTARAIAENDRAMAESKELLDWHKARRKLIEADKAARKAEAEKRGRPVDD